MTEEKGQTSRAREVVSAKLIGFYFTVLVFLAPAFVQSSFAPPFYPSFSFWGMIGKIWYNPDSGAWIFDYYWIGSTFIHSIPYTFLRPVFAYQMMRYYKGNSSRKQTLLIGLFIELQALIIDVPMILAIQRLDLIHIPIPLLLIAAVIVMRYRSPASSIKLWMEEEEENKMWWGSEGPKSAKLRYLRGITLNKVLGTILIAELILLIVVGPIVILTAPWQYHSFYEQALPLLILITGLPFLMTRSIKE